MSTDLGPDDVRPLGVDIVAGVADEPVLEVSKGWSLGARYALAVGTIDHRHVLVAGHVADLDLRWIKTRSTALALVHHLLQLDKNGQTINCRLVDEIGGDRGRT